MILTPLSEVPILIFFTTQYKQRRATRMPTIMTPIILPILVEFSVVSSRESTLGGGLGISGVGAGFHEAGGGMGVGVFVVGVTPSSQQAARYCRAM